MGVRTCSLTEDGSFGVEGLGRLAAAGLDVAELSFNRPAAGVVHGDRALADRFRAEAERLEMVLVAHAPDTFWLSNPDRAERRDAVRGVEEVLEGAAAYGARALVIHACPGQPLIPERRDEQYESLVHALECLAPACETRAVRLAVETMVPGRLTSSVATLIEAVDRVNSPWVGICLDTNHANLSQDLYESVRQAGQRVVEFHLNDNHFVKEEHLIPYEGAINWGDFANAVVASECSSYMVMEPGGQYEGDADILARAQAAATRLRGDIEEQSIE